MQPVIDVINGVGFPAFVAVYMLIVNKKSTDHNTEILNELKTAITLLCDRLSHTQGEDKDNE